MKCTICNKSEFKSLRLDEGLRNECQNCGFVI
jgi:DNA-directed RNA polymerase subunit RPC12/RpoP